MQIADDHEFRITKLEVWKTGNGAKGAEQRIQDLETRVLPENCIGVQAFKEYIKEEKEKAQNKRAFRIGDIANIVQFAMLIAALVALYRG